MRINVKPAAVSAAATFLLLLILDLTWPGHGVWLLIVGIVIGLAAAYVWWRDRVATDQHSIPNAHGTAFSDVGVYGLRGSALEPARRSSPGIPLSGLLAPISVLAILLFVGGALNSTDADVRETTVVFDQSATAIDRSRDGEPTTPQVAPPSAAQTQQALTTTTVATVQPPQTSTSTAESSSVAQQATTPVKPIVVAAPQAASPVEDETEEAVAVPELANAIEYIVEEGDTLYDIAERYDSTVDAIMNLNELDSYSFIHPGDVLLIPQVDEEGEES